LATAAASISPQLLRIGDLSRLSGKTVRAIHLYEELGLLQPASRTRGGFRLYEPHAVERLRWIDLLSGLGFSLHEMKALLDTWWSAGLGPDAMDHLRGLFAGKLEQTREAIRRHRLLERELEDGLAWLETCRECSAPAPVAGCSCCRQDHGRAEPALVAGITTRITTPRSGAAKPRAGAPASRTARAGFVRIEDITP
jgi:MerR family copper efflux transcriptional regulator